ncbi:MAG: elongation factor P maturation arginine rhamnosyltransferase EarP [Comamonadaceae bacterium]|nr:elongation factor P maturation arginine rhamnosyltransferase EarP [Comamonadaceae bacterium]
MPATDTAPPPLAWDIFCRVIDNYGDAGVCWRLACDLAGRGDGVRLWIDAHSALRWLSGAPASLWDAPPPWQHQGVRILPWALAESLTAGQLAALAPAPAARQAARQVLVEAFGCEIPDAYLHALAQRASGDASPASAIGPRPWPLWLNLEYLSAEPYVERMHLLPSPVMFGPAAGQSKTFFYPGLTPRTGGLLREPTLAQRQAQFDPTAWRRAFAPAQPAAATQASWISLFAYEPACLPQWLRAWAQAAQPVQLLAAAGRSQTWLRQCWQQLGWAGAQQAAASTTSTQGALTVHWLPFMPQAQFDELLWACDLNIVRGEDSLVRALWAARPFLWHIYPQHDDAHHGKLQAFMDWLQPPEHWRAALLQLNGMASANAPPLPAPGSALQGAQQSSWTHWQDCARAACSRLQAQPDLATQLRAWAAACAQQPT